MTNISIFFRNLPNNGEGSRSGLGRKNLPNNIQHIESDAKLFTQLSNLEKKIDWLIERKRIDFRQALKAPHKQKRILRVHIWNKFYPDGNNNSAGCYGPIPYWELKIEGHLLDDVKNGLKVVQKKL